MMIMMCLKNRLTGILILSAGWLMAACNALPAPEGENVDDRNTIDRMVIRASLVGGETRTVLSKDGGVYKVLWQTGDKVSVNGTLSEAVAAADNGKTAVDFTVNGSLSAPYKVLYPGSPAPPSSTS